MRHFKFPDQGQRPVRTVLWTFYSELHARTATSARVQH